MKKMTQCENNMSSYPSYICDECAKSNGGKWPEGHLSTFHRAKCGWCDCICDVANPRNWGYPTYKG